MPMAARSLYGGTQERDRGTGFQPVLAAPEQKKPKKPAISLASTRRRRLEARRVFAQTDEETILSNAGLSTAFSENSEAMRGDRLDLSHQGRQQIGAARQASA